MKVNSVIFLLTLLVSVQAFARESCTNEEFAKQISKGLPSGTESLVVRITECAHFGGEEAYDKERAAFIEAAVKNAKCDQIERDEKTILKKFSKKNRELKKVFQAAENWDEGSCQ